MSDSILTAEQVRAFWSGTSMDIDDDDICGSHERLREQRDEGMKREADFIKKWAAAEDRLARATAALKAARRAIPVSACDRSEDGSGACDYECDDGCLRIKAMDALAAVEEPAE